MFMFFYILQSREMWTSTSKTHSHSPYVKVTCTVPSEELEHHTKLTFKINKQTNTSPVAVEGLNVEKNCTEDAVSLEQDDLSIRRLEQRHLSVTCFLWRNVFDVLQELHLVSLQIEMEMFYHRIKFIRNLQCDISQKPTNKSGVRLWQEINEEWEDANQVWRSSWSISCL